MNTGPGATPSDPTSKEIPVPDGHAGSDGDRESTSSPIADEPSSHDGCLDGVLGCTTAIAGIGGSIALIRYVYRLVVGSPKLAIPVMGIVLAVLVGAHAWYKRLALQPNTPRGSRLQWFALIVQVVAFTVLVEVGWALLGTAILSLAHC